MNALRACSSSCLSPRNPESNSGPEPDPEPTTLLRPHRAGATDAAEPGEADIDTAAWILRRPPQGFEPTAAGVNAYYTGVKGYAEKMWEWEAVRRPYVLERMVRNHDGHGHAGVGGKVLKGVGKVLGIVREGERGEVGGDEGEGESEGEGDAAVPSTMEVSAAAAATAAPVEETPVAVEEHADGSAAHDDDDDDYNDDDATGGSDPVWDADAYERGSTRDYSLSGSDW